MVVPELHILVKGWKGSCILITIILSKNLLLKLVNSFWLGSIEGIASEGEEKSNTASGPDTEIDEDKTKGYGNTSHGSHLTKTSEGVAESEDVEGKKT
jgi:hypothetical protein